MTNWIWFATIFMYMAIWYSSIAKHSSLWWMAISVLCTLQRTLILTHTGIKWLMQRLALNFFLFFFPISISHDKRIKMEQNIQLFSVKQESNDYCWSIFIFAEKLTISKIKPFFSENAWTLFGKSSPFFPYLYLTRFMVVLNLNMLPIKRKTSEQLIAIKM